MDRYIAHAKPISEGRTGRILSATDRLNGNEVALKFVFVGNVAQNGLSHQLLRESAVWALVSSSSSSSSSSSPPSPSSTGGPSPASSQPQKNNDTNNNNNDHSILPLRDIFTSGSSIVFVSRRVQTDLQGVLESFGRRGSRMPLRTAKHILREVAKSLQFLHALGVLHRDLKPANVLCERVSARSSSSSSSSTATNFTGGSDEAAVSKKSDEPQLPRVYLGDFGLSRCAAQDRMTHEVVSRAYRAPELLLGCSEYTSAIDMWAFGCVATDLIAGTGSTPLFASCSDLEQLRKVFDVIGSPKPGLFSSSGSAHAAADTTTASSVHSSVQSSGGISFTSRPPKKNWAREVGRGLEHSADFFQRLLAHDAAVRMSATECLEHPFLAVGSESTPITSDGMMEATPAFFHASSSEFLQRVTEQSASSQSRPVSQCA